MGRNEGVENLKSLWDIHIGIWATDYRSLTSVLDGLSNCCYVRDMFSLSLSSVEVPHTKV